MLMKQKSKLTLNQYNYWVEKGVARGLFEPHLQLFGVSARFCGIYHLYRQYNQTVYVPHLVVFQ